MAPIAIGQWEQTLTPYKVLKWNSLQTPPRCATFEFSLCRPWGLQVLSDSDSHYWRYKYHFENKHLNMYHLYIVLDINFSDEIKLLFSFVCGNIFECRKKVHTLGLAEKKEARWVDYRNYISNEWTLDKPYTEWMCTAHNSIVRPKRVFYAIQNILFNYIAH